MALVKKTNMATIPVEQPLVDPIISPIPTGSGTNIEPISQTPNEISPLGTVVDSELSVLQDLKNAQLDIGTSPAIKHLAGSKTRVIYFNQMEPKQSNDVVNVVNPSAVNNTKYNRIENFIIITDSEINSSFQVEDDGVVNNEQTSSGLVYPGTVQPYPNDLFFVYEDMEHVVLYRITAVTPIYNSAETGFKIEFMKHYDQFDPDQMTNLISGYYVFNFEAVGTGNKSVLEKTMYASYKMVTDIFNTMSEEYTSRFFNRDKNIIKLDYEVPKASDILQFVDMGKPLQSQVSEMLLSADTNGVMHIFDPYVIEFFGKAFEKSKVQHKGYSIYPIMPVWIDDAFKQTYKFTIYNAIVRRNPELIKYPYVYPIKFQKRTIRDCIYDGWYYFEPITAFGENCIDIFPPNFINRIKSNTPYSATFDDVKYLKYNVIISFMNKKDYVPTVDELKPFIDSVELMSDVELYGIGPLILYMCTYYQDLIQRKTY